MRQNSCIVSLVTRGADRPAYLIGASGGAGKLQYPFPAFLRADLVNRLGAKPLYGLASLLLFAALPLKLPSQLPIVAEEPRISRNSITGLQTFAEFVKLLQHPAL